VVLVPGLGALARDGLGWALMGLSGPSSTMAGLPGGGGDNLEGSRDDGSMASLLQHNGRSFTGPSRAGRARQGLVCSRCYVY
jgi:hypothetical protein